MAERELLMARESVLQPGSRLFGRARLTFGIEIG